MRRPQADPVTDLTKLSDEQLKALYQQAPPLSNMSDEQLKAAYEATKPKGVVANAADFLKSIPRGILSGAVGSAAGQAQTDPAYAMGQAMMPVPSQTPTAEDVTKAVEQNVTGELPQPQGRAGKFGQAIGEGLEAR
jgi:hypothetical protein